jgi:hypothetical protein
MYRHIYQKRFTDQNIVESDKRREVRKRNRTIREQEEVLTAAEAAAAESGPAKSSKQAKTGSKSKTKPSTKSSSASKATSKSTPASAANTKSTSASKATSKSAPASNANSKSTSASQASSQSHTAASNCTGEYFDIVIQNVLLRLFTDEEAKNVAEMKADERRCKKLIASLHMRDDTPLASLKLLDLPELEALWARGEGSAAKTPVRKTSASLARSNVRLQFDPSITLLTLFLDQCTRFPTCSASCCQGPVGKGGQTVPSTCNAQAGRFA